MKRKLLSFLLICVLVIGLTGCDNTTKEIKSTTNTQIKNVEEKDKISKNNTVKKGKISSGEIGLPMRNSKLVLPCGIYGRWED